MPDPIIFILGFLIGGGGVYFLTSRKVCPVCTTSKIGIRVKQQQIEKQARKEKILEILHERGGVTNDDIEMAFNVSDTTATNYLQELEDEGLIKQVGERGRFVSYHLINK